MVRYRKTVFVNARPVTQGEIDNYKELVNNRSGNINEFHYNMTNDAINIIPINNKQRYSGSPKKGDMIVTQCDNIWDAEYVTREDFKKIYRKDVVKYSNGYTIISEDGKHILSNKTITMDDPNKVKMKVYKTLKGVAQAYNQLTNLGGYRYGVKLNIVKVVNGEVKPNNIIII